MVGTALEVIHSKKFGKILHPFTKFGFANIVFGLARHTREAPDVAL